MVRVGEVAVYYQPAIIISKSIYLNQQIYFIINILAIWVQAVLRRNR
jgi:subtilase family serine protease